MKRELHVVLLGNPNSGKTTIFNNLSGSRQHVGNYPGVTVEFKEAKINYNDHIIKLIDLPGAYSLSSQSPDEKLARDYIFKEKPDLIVYIADASNIQRNLYLYTQLIDLQIPVILGFNMMDEAKKAGLIFDLNFLAEILGSPIVPLIGRTSKGSKELLDEIIRVASASNNAYIPRFLSFPDNIQKEIDHISELSAGLEKENIYIENEYLKEIAASSDSNQSALLNNHYLAIKLLENDDEIQNMISNFTNGEKILASAKNARERISNRLGDEAEYIISDARYAHIRGAYREAVRIEKSDAFSITEKVDNILLNRALGIPLFLLLMWGLFQITFTVGEPLMGLIENGVASLSLLLYGNLGAGLLESLIIDGVIAGVGGVIVFVPNILLLFLGIAFLEGSGYMSRAAFLMDRVMHSVGLHGKSFIPLLIGFGCSVPAIMATRTLDNERDRLATMLITPFMSCGAKLPVYVLLIGAFFTPQYAGTVLFSLYLLGILIALLSAKLFRKTIFLGESDPFVMELPTYKLPTFKSIVIHMWDRTWMYLQKAGTIILAFAILMWALTTFPLQVEVQANEEAGTAPAIVSSYAGQIGHFIEPVIEPLGFNWQIGVALIGGFAAKEVVVSTLATVYSIEAADESSPILREALRSDNSLNPLVAYVLMVFILLYLPCMAVIAIIRKETGGWKWPIFTTFYTISVAWIVSFIIYRAGMFFGIGI